MNQKGRPATAGRPFARPGGRTAQVGGPVASVRPRGRRREAGSYRAATLLFSMVVSSAWRV